jgi:Tfp pilus assembly protein PilN
MIEINLLPGAAHKARSGESSFSLSEVLADFNKHFKDKYLIGASAAGALGLAAIATMFFYQRYQEQVINEREQMVARDSARFSAVLLARRSAETTRDSVYQQLAIIKSIDDSRYTWPHVLEEINLALPPYTWLTSIEQTSAVTTTAGINSDTSAAGKAKADSAKKRGGDNSVTAAKRKRLHADSLFSGDASATAFRIVGQTVDIQALTRFMKSLEASPFIKNVQLTRSDLVTTGNQTVTEFQLQAETEVPPPALLQTVPLSVAVH